MSLPAVPFKVVDAIDELTRALRRAPEAERAVIERLEAIEGQLAAARAGIEPLAPGLERLLATARPELEHMPSVEALLEEMLRRLDRVAASVERVNGGLERIGQRLPGDDSGRGALAKARDAITGG